MEKQKQAVEIPVVREATTPVEVRVREKVVQHISTQEIITELTGESMKTGNLF